MARETTEKKLKEKVKQLEVSLKEALEQIHFYKQELEIITEYCGRENNSLNDALSAIRAKYRANIEQFQVQLQVRFCIIVYLISKTLNQERKKLKKIATTQAEENRQLRTKIELLEKAHLNNSQGIQPNEEILEQLQQINQELFSKSQKTSDFRVDSNLFQSLKLTNLESPTTQGRELKASGMLKSSHKRSLSE